MFYFSPRPFAGVVYFLSVFLLCQKGQAQSCSTVSNFPFTENFESGLGLWTQATDDGFNWTRQTGGTPALGTGPSEAANGNYYIYTDSRSPNSPWKTAVLNSPCIDFTNTGGGKIYFFYHMNGNNMGWVQLQVSRDNGANWNVEWGAGGIGYGDKWIQQQADLSEYAGETIKIRFFATMNSGVGGDIALDDISVTSYPKYQAPVLSNENYVLTRSYQRETSSPMAIHADRDVVENVTYFDGLGRPIQQVAVKASPDSKDIITHINYDAFGRKEKDWLPVRESAGAAGSFRSAGIETAVKGYYYDAYPEDFAGITNSTDTNPYSEKSFEASPLNRILEQGAPGADWKLDKNSDSDHTIKFSYHTNASTEVRLYRVELAADYTPTLVNSSADSFYGENQLYKTVTKNENWTSGKNNTTEEFTDKQGRVVLKRSYADMDLNSDGDMNEAGELEAAHDTYYVYDDYGNLTFVLPPKSEPTDTDVALSQDKLNNLCYLYKYDERNRLVEKKIPGKEPEYIIYNNLDQPVMTQDGEQRAKTSKEWLFTRYDAFGRVAYTGKLADNRTRSQIQAEAKGFSGQLWVNRGPVISLGGASVYYTNNGLPATGIDKILTVNYFDDYDFPQSLQGFSIHTESRGGVPLSNNVKGLPTFTQSRVLGTSSFTRTLMKYDDKGRETWRSAKNDYLQTTHFITYKLDFTGKILDAYTWHNKGDQPETIYMDHYDYDHAGRLLSHSQMLKDWGFPVEIIVENTYNELGQLVIKGVGNGAGRERLQNIKYTYNIRGWLKTINDVTDLSTENDLFAFKINYANPEMNSPEATALFNGNIRETIWKTANDISTNTTRGYAYHYDALNRIISGDFGLKTTGSFNLASGYDMQVQGYDKNGNIKKLNRDGSPAMGSIDQLSYQYEDGDISNRLRKVEDGSLSAEGFINGKNISDEYSYDDNGNMILDANKGITSISYNHLNLPDLIDVNGGNISYLYDATGTKQRKTVASTTTDYIENFIYINGDIKFFSHPEGYVEPDGNGGYNYVYNYTDNLGNVRLTYADLNNNGTIEASSEILDEKNYYPFGGEHAGYNTAVKGTYHPYGFNGKEEQDELGLQWMDFGARNYDKWLGRWMNVDPLSEIAPDKTPYHFVSNNPINRIDPNGLTDYKVNSDGEVSQVGDPNDDPDRILKTRSDGSVKRYGDGIFGFLTKKSKRGLAKVSVDNVAKGILSDGQNFSTEEGALIGLGEGANSANRSEVFEFMLDLSEHLNIEVGATLYSDSESSVSSDPTHIGIASIRRNSISASNSGFSIDSYKARNNLWESSFNEIGRAHTHPTGSIFKTYQPSDVDIINMQSRQNRINGLRHFLIHRPQNRRSVRPFTPFEYTNSQLSDFNYPTN